MVPGEKKNGRTFVFVLKVLCAFLGGCSAGLIGLSWYVRKSEQRLISHPVLMSDLQQKRLLGFTLGKPVPSECRHLIGDRVDDRKLLTANFDFRASKTVAYDLRLEKEEAYSFFHSACVLIEWPSCHVVGVYARFYFGQGQFGVPEEGKWNPRRYPGVLYWGLLDDLFRSFGSFKTELRGDCWQSGNIYQTRFVVNEDFEIDLNFHEQFGKSLFIHGVDVPNVELHDLPDCTVPQQDVGRRLIGERHPAKSLYMKYAVKRNCFLSRFIMVDH